MLGKKQNIKNDEWLEQVKNIENIITIDEIKKLAQSTINQIKKETQNKKCAYAWSAGKDSIVLSHLCEKSGMVNCMIGVCDLEYPEFYNWVEKNKPENCEIINTKQNLDWLVQHQNMLFPQDSKTAARWFSIVQHKAQKQYVKKNNIDIILLGRRKADGNYVGKNSNIYTSNGVTRYSPLSEWTHEQILAYIHYYNLPLPPIYGWKNGYLCGTHPWPARQWTKSTENGWKEIYDIDKNIVINAAEKIESAKLFLEGVNK